MVRFWHDLWCGEQPLKFPFLKLSLLLVVRMCGWQIICSSGMGTFIGIFALQDPCMIGRWKWSLISLGVILYIH
jgi:hypothetical protein